MIGTPGNKEILREAGVLGDAGAQAGPEDLIIALRASSAKRPGRDDRDAAPAGSAAGRRLGRAPPAARLRGAMQQSPMPTSR
jgi:hypothetical protein